MQRHDRGANSIGAIGRSVNPRTRIMLAFTSGQPGGAELATADLVPHAPLDLELSALLLSPGGMAKIASDLGLDVRVASLAGRPSVRQAIRFHRGLRTLLRQDRPDVLFAIGVKAAVLSVLAARAEGVPIVWRKVDFAYDGWLSRPLSRLCAGVIAVSEAVGRSVHPAKLTAVVGVPVRLGEDYRVSTPRPPATIGSVGRLVPYKGHHHVIEAAGRLSQTFADVRVVIAGGAAPEAPDYEDRLMETARRHGLEDRVEIIGHVDRIEEVLERLTVFVVATYQDELGFGREGLGAAMLEASWAGLPIVATSGGGSPEGLQDGVTGTLVEPGEPGAIAAAIGELLSDPQAARAAGDAGANFARERCRPAEVADTLFGHVRSLAR